MARLRLAALVFVLGAATTARGDFFTTAYSNAGFTSPGGNAVIGGHQPFKVFGDGTTSRLYVDQLYPVNPTPEIILNRVGTTLLQTLTGVDSRGSNFGTNFSYIDNNQFAGATNNGTPELSVRSYSTFATSGAGVGADFYITYTPQVGTNDPRTGLHWLQIINTNWYYDPTVKKSFPGRQAEYVDVTPGSAAPFYDAGNPPGDAGTNYLFDRPTRNSRLLATYTGALPLTWQADLFLVQDTGMKDANNKEIIKIWDGVEYGFQITPATPEPSSLALSVLGVAGLMAYARRRRTASA
jgi:hypothetical protein